MENLELVNLTPDKMNVRTNTTRLCLLCLLLAPDN